MQNVRNLSIAQTKKARLYYINGLKIQQDFEAQSLPKNTNALVKIKGMSRVRKAKSFKIRCKLLINMDFNCKYTAM
jgi:hypothetical protein